MTEAAPRAVLVIEDNPADARLVREHLSRLGPEADAAGFQLTLAESLQRARAALLGATFDAVLLDLELPDSTGENTLDDVLTLAGKAPVIVVTGVRDQSLGEHLIARGAEDYLPKNEMTGELLARALRYAIERTRLRRRAEMAEAEVRRERERRALEQLTTSSESSEAARLYDAAPLQESDPRLFARIVEEYIVLVTHEATSQVYKTARPARASHIKALAEQLGHLFASPRDVIAIHTEALRAIAERLPPAEERLIAVESRLVVLELMGYLVTFYRRFYWNAPAQHA